MDPTRHRELASRGGKPAHQQGIPHESTQEARDAGRKGGNAPHRRRQVRPESGGPLKGTAPVVSIVDYRRRGGDVL